MPSDQENAKQLLRLIYGVVMPENPYALSVMYIVQAFHRLEGVRLPSSMRPEDLTSSHRFFSVIETTAGVTGMDELVGLARMFPGETVFKNHLNMLRDQIDLPVIPFCYVAANATEQLRQQLLNLHARQG